MKLVLFDIDGTLVSMNHGESRRVFMEVFRRMYGAEISEDDLPEFSGNTDLGICRHICERKNIPFYNVLSTKSEFWAKMERYYTPYYSREFITMHEGVSELLEWVSEHPEYEVGLLTGNMRLGAFGKLRPFGLDIHFKEGAYGCDHYDRNILPRIAWDRFNALVPGYGFGPENTIIIGDSDKDILCAKSSGAKVISVATGSHTKTKLSHLRPDFLLDSFADLDDVKSKIQSLSEEVYA